MLRGRFVLREREISSQLIEKNTVEKLSNISSDVSMNMGAWFFLERLRTWRKKELLYPLLNERCNDGDGKKIE